MRTACFAAEKGHKVTLYEKTGYLGGKAKYADIYAGKWPIRDYRLWLIDEAARRGVEVKLCQEPTPDELKRLENTAPPQKRFHYRHRAAELGWWAASLMPNDSDKTAHILNTAGGWLKNRAPQEANRFYQALVIRCGNTRLGKQAAARNWFPEEKAETVVESAP
jgi:hypothetical protein